MSGGNVYANLEAFEDTLNGSLTITLARKSRNVKITNDSATVTLKFKFKSTESFASVLPTESVDLEMWIQDIFLQTSSSAPYRIWAFG